MGQIIPYLWCHVVLWVKRWSPWHLRKQVAAYQRHVEFLDDTLAGHLVSLKHAQSTMARYERRERAKVQAEVDELVQMTRVPEGTPPRNELLADLRRDEGLDGHLSGLMDDDGSPGS